MLSIEYRSEGKLRELRPGGICLFYFAHINRQFVILHGFQKKTNKTPSREIEIAARRMIPVSTYTFKNWQKEQLSDPEFVAAAYELEPGYQIACLRMERGLTQAQLAELVGAKQSSIARLERGETTLSLQFFNWVAAALNANFEIRIIPDQC